MQTRSSKSAFAWGVLVVICLAALGFIALNWTRFVTISGRIDTGASKTYEIQACTSRVVATMTSTNGNMNVRVLVDGQTLKTQTDSPRFDLNEGIDFGLHTVQMIVENPAVPGANTHILITGQLSCNLP
jgi:hypothetical protein